MAFGFRIISPDGRLLAKSLHEKNTTKKEITLRARKELRRKNVPKGSHSEVFKIDKSNNVFDDFMTDFF